LESTYYEKFPEFVFQGRSGILETFGSDLVQKWKLAPSPFTSTISMEKALSRIIVMHIVAPLEKMSYRKEINMSGYETKLKAPRKPC